ncbi:MAG: transcriptional regulator [Acidimicrobiales bacterium]
MTNIEDMALEADDLSYAAKVGKRLRAIRKQKRLSLQEVESQSSQEFKASVLGAYERGERAISVPRLQRLAAFYSIPVDQLLPRMEARGAVEVIDLGEEKTSTTVPGPVTIDLRRITDAAATPERERLGRFLQALQLQRGDFNGRMLTVRRDDIWALGAILDTPPAKASTRLEELGLLLSA